MAVRLEITGYSNIQRNWSGIQSLLVPHQIDVYNNDFPDHLAGIEPGRYFYDKSHSILLPSISYYNWWRNCLSYKILGVSAREVWNNPDFYSDSSFYPLINHSDSEGFIGTGLCDRLFEAFGNFSGDFIHYRPEGNESDYEYSKPFFETYKGIWDALSYAYENGVLEFKSTTVRLDIIP